MQHGVCYIYDQFVISRRNFIYLFATICLYVHNLRVYEIYIFIIYIL